MDKSNTIIKEYRYINTGNIKYSRGVVMTRIGIASQDEISTKLPFHCDAECQIVREGICDVLLIGTHPPLHTRYTSAKTLIAPDCVNVDSLSGFSAKNVVSYGLCKKNTVTVSSLIGNRLVVSLQRELPTLYGDRLLEQDFCVNLLHAENADSVLGTVALLLVCGVPPHEISELSFS